MQPLTTSLAPPDNLLATDDLKEIMMKALYLQPPGGNHLNFSSRSDGSNSATLTPVSSCSSSHSDLDTVVSSVDIHDALLSYPAGRKGSFVGSLVESPFNERRFDIEGLLCSPPASPTTSYQWTTVDTAPTITVTNMDAPSIDFKISPPTTLEGLYFAPAYSQPTVNFGALLPDYLNNNNNNNSNPVPFINDNTHHNCKSSKIKRNTFRTSMDDIYATQSAANSLAIHKCNYCGKGYTRVYDLIRHQRSHTGFKPYQCDVCQKSYSRSDSLLQHRRQSSCGNLEGSKLL